MSSTSEPSHTASPVAEQKAEGSCSGVYRWYLHLASSAGFFLIGLAFLLTWRLISALRRWLSHRKVLKSTEHRVFASALPEERDANKLTVASDDNFVNTRRRCNVALRDLVGRLVSPHTSAGRVALVLNFALSMTSVAFYAYEAVVWAGRVEWCYPWRLSPLMITDLAFNCVYLLRFCLRFLAAPNKLQFWLEVQSFVDYCTIPPAFVGMFLHQYWLGLRFVRVLHLTSLPDVLQRIGLLHSGSFVRLMQLVTIFVCVWFLGASAIHVLENSASLNGIGNTSGVTFGDCLYFTIVTMSTVGFGDISPSTNWGRAFISLYILVALGVFASYTPEIAGMISARSRHSGQYKPEHGSRHIVVCGAPSAQSVDTFLANLLHADRKLSTSLNVVCLFPMKPSPEFQKLLKRYYRNLVYLEGTILSITDCKRARLNSAKAAIILARQDSAEPDDEDAENTMRVLSIKNVAPNVRCIVQLLQYHSKQFLEFIPNWDWRRGDECVCSTELRLGLLAQSCAAPGFSTLMANFFATRSPPNWLDLDAWEADYRMGAANEIYSECFGTAFGGMTFVEAAAVCYSELGVILVAVMPEQSSEETDDAGALLLNPSGPAEGFEIPKSGQPCRGFFLADSQDDMRLVLGMDEATACEALERFRARYADDPVVEATAAEPCSFDPARGETHWCEARELIESEALLPVRNARSKAVQFKGHYVLCIAGGEDFNGQLGLCSFVAPLRSRAYHRRDLVPIVIVCDRRQLELEWTDLCNFPEVYAVAESPMRRASLRAAGIDQCDMCIVISGGHCYEPGADQVDPYLMDREVVMCTLNIKAIGLPGGSEVYYRALGLPIPPSVRELGAPIVTEILIDKNIQYLDQDDDDDDEIEEIHNTEAFACGSAFSAGVLDSLLATVYYNSSAMRLITALVTGGASQHCHVGSTGQVESALPASRVTQLSMLMDKRLSIGCETFRQMFLTLLRRYGILCFGVHRYRDSYYGGRPGHGGGSNKRIVIACPCSEFRMLKSDMVFCLLPATKAPAPDPRRA